MDGMSGVTGHVQSNEVGGSTKMEKEGLARSLKFCEQRQLAVDAIVTDRHPQVQKYLREQYPSVVHSYDVWHVAKGVHCQPYYNKLTLLSLLLTT
jgi:hypothetical protein